MSFIIGGAIALGIFAGLCLVLASRADDHELPAPDGAQKEKR